MLKSIGHPFSLGQIIESQDFDALILSVDKVVSGSSGLLAGSHLVTMVSRDPHTWGTRECVVCLVVVV